MSEFVALGQHATVLKGKPPASEAGYSGRDALPYLSPEYLRGNASAEQVKPSSHSVLAQDGETILLWDGSNAGEFFKAKFGIVASTMARIKPDETFSPAYFFHVAKQSERRLKDKTNGTGIPHVDREVLETALVFRPQADQQVEIARVLDTLDTAIAQTETIIAKLNAVKQGLLHDLLTRGIGDNGELRPPQNEAPQLYKQSALGWIPKEWVAGAIVECLEKEHGVKPGPFGSSIKKDSYTKVGFKVYGQEQVIAGDQALGDYFIPLRKYQELSDFSVKTGDVLISLVGTIGRVLVLRDPLQPGLINPRLMRLRPEQRIIRPDFLGLLVSSPIITRQLASLAGGGTMPVINKKIISGVVGANVPVDEQDAILRTHKAIERRIAEEERMLDKLRLERTGLMDDLLYGKVRVTALIGQAEGSKARGTQWAGN